MAREHLEYAAQTARRLRSAYPDDYERIARAVKLREEEPETWEHAAIRMHLPFDEKRGIDAQAGIDAIRAAGMYAVGVGRGLKGADWSIIDTTELSLPELRKRFLAVPPQGPVPPRLRELR